jgi:hypothetical protein
LISLSVPRMSRSRVKPEGWQTPWYALSLDDHPPILTVAVGGSTFFVGTAFRFVVASLESVATGSVQRMGRVRLRAHLRVQSPALLLAQDQAHFPVACLVLNRV